MKQPEIGTILIATDVCEMSVGNNALIIGDEYKVHSLNNLFDEIAIKSELYEDHIFSTREKDNCYWGNFFRIKPDSNEETVIDSIKKYIHDKIEYCNSQADQYPIDKYGTEHSMSDEQMSGYYQGMGEWLNAVLLQIEELESSPNKPQFPEDTIKRGEG